MKDLHTHTDVCVCVFCSSDEIVTGIKKGVKEDYNNSTGVTRVADFEAGERAKDSQLEVADAGRVTLHEVAAVRVVGIHAAISIHGVVF